MFVGRGGWGVCPDLQHTPVWVPPSGQKKKNRQREIMLTKSRGGGKWREKKNPWRHFPHPYVFF